MKKFLFIITAILFAFLLFGCDGSENFEESSNVNVMFWTDEDTGVQYVIYSDSGGYSGMGGITPRLNSDGSLYTENEVQGDD